MSAIWVRRFVDALIVLGVLALLAQFYAIGSSLAEGKFHMLSLPAESDTFTVLPFGDWDGQWDMRRGDIRVNDHIEFRTLQEGAKTLSTLVFIAVLYLLRRTLSAVSRREVFVDRNVSDLRLIGWLLIAGTIVTAVVQVILQYAVLDGIPVNADRAAVSAIGSYVPGVANVKLDFPFSLRGLFMAAIAFAFAGALQSGKAYREDSESVV